MKKVKLLSILLSILIAPTLILSNASKVDACSFWNPFCKNTDVLKIPPSPKPRPTQPSIQAYPRLMSDYYRNDNIVWDELPKSYVSDKFTLEERNLIWESLNKTQEIFKKPAFYECVQSYTTKKNGNGSDPTIYDGSNPGFAVRAFLSNFPRNDKHGGRSHLIFIDKMQLSGEEANVAGRADVPKKGNPMYDFIIKLNTNKFSEITSPDVWAGIIVHEMLHNVGYTHPKIINDDFDPIAGNFVYEAGYCAAGGGSRTTFLNGNNKLFVD